MKKVFYIFSFCVLTTIFSGIFSCNQPCVDSVVLETLEMDLRVNSENFGITTQQIKNVGDTIRSTKNQFYNYPETRRFGELKIPSPSFFINTSYAKNSDCPEQIDYATRFEAENTEFWLDVDYDASALGEGMLAAETNLLENNIVRTSYLQGFDNNPFLLGGAPTFLSLEKDFFASINNQWVTFYFLFVEENGIEFMDSTRAYVDFSF